MKVFLFQNHEDKANGIEDMKKRYPEAIYSWKHSTLTLEKKVIYFRVATGNSFINIYYPDAVHFTFKPEPWQLNVVKSHLRSSRRNCKLFVKDKQVPIRDFINKGAI